MLCQSKMAYNHLNGAVHIHNRDEGVDINVQGKKSLPVLTNAYVTTSVRCNLPQKNVAQTCPISLYGNFIHSILTLFWLLDWSTITEYQLRAQTEVYVTHTHRVICKNVEKETAYDSLLHKKVEGLCILEVEMGKVKRKGGIHEPNWATQVLLSLKTCWKISVYLKGHNLVGEMKK